VVVEDGPGKVIAFTFTSTYWLRECYADIAEFSVYVARGRGTSRLATAALIDAAKRASFWKLVSRVLPENTLSRAQLRPLSFREDS